MKRKIQKEDLALEIQIKGSPPLSNQYKKKKKGREKQKKNLFSK